MVGERLYDYIVEDRTWVHLDPEAFERDWQPTKEIATQSKETQDRKAATRLTILGNLGDNVRELVDNRISDVSMDEVTCVLWERRWMKRFQFTSAKNGTRDVTSFCLSFINSLLAPGFKTIP